MGPGQRLNVLLRLLNNPTLDRCKGIPVLGELPFQQITIPDENADDSRRLC